MATHHFSPTEYHVTLGPHPPALRIQDGDTVVTTTVDARGRDASGQIVTGELNPLTGPFFVEGAMPGDALAVRLDAIVPNRTWAWSLDVLATNAVTPEYVLTLPPRKLVNWVVDVAQGTARLEAPPRGLENFAVPLAPMFGCLGVAPRNGQVISTVTAGEHGGNMDWNGFGPGVTAYFPVFTPGALFCLGDGHAAQGDGEIGGTGIELSMNAQFTVRVLKNKPLRTVCGENAEFIFTIGNARPLDGALQLATTEMHQWLMRDYGLDAYGASLLLAQSVRYEVGNMFDPAYTMVCKIPKRLLP
ncbi:MAG: acetamidase/formamidase family protein [Verrucomicrobia bacterium]|nr:acetamidase/formamidase family protein [Verrucomicrobiota bacterium]